MSFGKENDRHTFEVSTTLHLEEKLMSKMGKYCKAYPVNRFRQFHNWIENTNNVRKETKQVDNQEIDMPRSLEGEDILYLQENFTVTDGIFLDENVIYDRVNDEWINYCRNTLKFEVPNYEQAPETAALGNG
jgi:hypothetical protein